LIAVRTQRWIDYWTGVGAAEFAVYLTRMTRYADLVDAEIAARDLPKSLRYLPIIESGYFHSAQSSAGAAGLWQFMSGTARDVGLTVTPLIDERRDPARSTPKALAVLAEHRERFASWYLALAAYNAGPGRISGLLRRHAVFAKRGDSLYVALDERLPRETRDFIPKLLAASTLAGSPERYGFEVREAPPFRFEEVHVPDATSVDVIAQAAGVSQDLIEALNPQLLRGFTPADREALVRVPPGRGAAFRRNYALIPADERVSFLEHVVVTGETFGHIAMGYGVPVDLLRGANPGIEPRLLQIGHRLIVPMAPAS
jgi:membrane-bound lytic murein transglycosylase D